MRASEPGTAGWANWSGRQTSSPSAVVTPSTVDELVEAVSTAADRGLPVRAVGASHSHSRVAATDGLLIETDGWKGLLDTTEDAEGRIASFRSGTRIHEIGAPLHGRGLALRNQGDIDKQSIAGAIGTGTHGTGPTLGNFSTSVVGLRILLADGRIVDCGPDREADLFDVGRHSIGGVGVVTEVDLRVRERYLLHERLWSDDPDHVMGRIDELTTATRHFEFFWMPKLDRCACKSLDELAVDAPHDGAVAGDDWPEDRVETPAKLQRQGWSHRIISSIRDDKHTEMEYSVPAEVGPECFLEVRAMIRERFPDLEWPVEYRTLAADDVLLSTARGRATVTISVHQDIALDDRPLFEASEEIFARYGGRPHWGKAYYRSGSDLAELHQDYDRWWAIRDRYDPNGVFLTEDLAALRP